MDQPETQSIVGIVLKAVAVGLSIAGLVIGIIPGSGDVDTQVTLLSIGLAAVAVAALAKES